MSDDRRTKAQIIAELEKAQDAVRDLESRIPEPLQPVPSADALARCIRALDSLNKSQSVLDRERRLGAHEVTSVIKHLLNRYGIDLTVRTVEPCNRPHVDEVSDGVLIDRLRGRY